MLCRTSFFLMEKYPISLHGQNLDVPTVQKIAFKIQQCSVFHVNQIPNLKYFWGGMGNFTLECFILKHFGELHKQIP